MRRVARGVARIAGDPDDAARIEEVGTEMRAIADSLAQI
jgi:hypothetical protein